MVRNLLFLCFLTFAEHGPPSSWVLQKDKDGVKVYTRTTEGSSIKSVRVTTSARSTPTAVIALLMDINHYPQWVYNCKRAYVIKEISPLETYHYQEVSAPWPVENRDLVIHTTVQQNSSNKEVIFKSGTNPDMVPEKKDLVRVKKFSEQWTVTPRGKDMVDLTYEISTDPSGNIPANLINAFIVTGPYNTTQKLLEQIKKPEYANARLGYIK